MSQNDLTTYASVLAFAEGSPDATVVAQLIRQLSAAMLSFLNRDTLLLKSYSDWYDGTGGVRQMLRKFPVLSVSAVSVGNVAIAANTNRPCGPGYVLDDWDGVPAGVPQDVTLSGYCFTCGKSNINISYLSGYGVVGEDATIPDTPFQVVPQSVYGLVAKDFQVTFADGTVLTPVTANPVAGQYIAPNPFDLTTPTSYYTFAAADTGEAVKLSYSFIPDAIEGAMCQWIAEVLEYRKRLGVAAKTLGGQETMSYRIKDMPDYVRLAVQSFKSVIPI